MGNQDWETPPDFWAVLNEEFGFQLDAAASVNNTKCKAYIEEGALWEGCAWVCETEIGVWRTRVYCNPPFTNMMPWVQKAYAEAQKHPYAVVGVVGPLSAAKWFVFCYEAAREIRILTPRIQFVAPPGLKQSSNSKDNVFIVFRYRSPLEDVVLNEDAIISVWNWRERS